MNKYKSISFSVTGMHCTACSNRLEKKLINTKGVVKSTVNFASSTALVQFQPTLTDTDELSNIANSLGFTMSPVGEEGIKDKTIKKDLFFVIVSWVFTLLLALPMYTNLYTPPPHFGTIIAGITILIPGFTILKSAFSSITSGIMGMDVLIALGAITAWVSDLLPLFGVAIPDYSMTAVMLIAINLTGRLIETTARGSASKAVNNLANFSGKFAHKIDENGKIYDVLIADLKLEDCVQVKAGEKIPTDGLIIEGRTSTDESFLTGESLPIDKQPGNHVYGGSINLDGLIVVRVTKDPKNTVLAQTIKLIQEAQGTKMPIQIFADKVTAVFVPIILTLSFLCFAIWFAFPNAFPSMFPSVEFPISTRLSSAISAAISVLVIACPCALGLATPMALVNGSALGAKKGILIRQGSAIQNLCDINIIALDKTGTLTKGKPQVTSYKNISGETTRGILTGLELTSTHPLANAIIQYSKENNITPKELTEVKNMPGQGIKGTHDNTEWFAGSYKSTLEYGVEIPEELQQHIDLRLEKGETLVCLSNLTTNKCETVASFADTLTPEAQESIHQLKQMGKKIMIITGDHKNAANNIAKKLDIKSVLFECSPKQKLDTIKSLQDQKYKVCFVGDGVNDAAALEKADVGIAIGTGTDIAIDSGGIVLVTGSLTALVLSFKLATATFNKIKQNLGWAFGYNVIAIPIAFSGMLSPILAEVFMTFSSLLVIGNSVLLSYKKL